MVAGAICMAAAVAVAVAAGLREPGRSDEALPRVVSAAQLAERWSPREQGLAVTGFEFGESSQLTWEVIDMLMVAGVLPVETPQLLPAAFLRALGRLPGRPERIALGGGVEAYHFRGLGDPRSGRPLEVFVAPADDGVATAVCSGVPVGFRECAAVARSRLRRRARPLRLGPDTAFLQRLPGTVHELNAALGGARAAERRARTAAEQVPALARATGAYDLAARTLAPLVVSGHGRPGRLVRALSDVSRAYERLAAGIADGSATPAGIRRTMRERQASADRLLRELSG
jgi:hypothetical protein